MRPTPALTAISTAALLVTLFAGVALGQTDDDVMSPVAEEGSTAFAVVGLQLVDSTGTGDALVGATSPSAAALDLREVTTADDGSRSMAVVEAIPVPAGGTVVLTPVGYHLALIDPVEGLSPGDSIELTLDLDVAGSMPATAVVISLDAIAPPAVQLPTTITVEALDNFFQPKTLEASANTEIKVVLKNYGFLPHNIAFYTDDTATRLLAEGSLTSVIDPETEAIARFTTPGPGEYFILCVIHPEMTGTFTVR